MDEKEKSEKAIAATLASLIALLIFGVLLLVWVVLYCSGVPLGRWISAIAAALGGAVVVTGSLKHVSANAKSDPPVSERVGDFALGFAKKYGVTTVLIVGFSFATFLIGILSGIGAGYLLFHSDKPKEPEPYISPVHVMFFLGFLVAFNGVRSAFRFRRAIKIKGSLGKEGAEFELDAPLSETKEGTTDAPSLPSRGAH